MAYLNLFKLFNGVVSSDNVENHLSQRFAGQLESTNNIRRRTITYLLTSCIYSYGTVRLHQLPLSLRKPHSGTSSSISYSPIPSPITSSSSDSPLCTSITPSLFHSRIKNLPLLQILPPIVSLLPPGLPPRTFAWAVSSELGFWFYFSLFFVSGPCARLS